MADAAAEIDAVTGALTNLVQALAHAQAALVDVAQGRAASALDAMDELYHRYNVAGDHTYLPSIALPIIDALIDLDRPLAAVERFERLWQGFSRTSGGYGSEAPAPPRSSRVMSTLHEPRSQRSSTRHWMCRTSTRPPSPSDPRCDRPE
ncbi:MAG: hypothetical protein R2697_09830 [Ilumatobacteraceae bacterium]